MKKKTDEEICETINSQDLNTAAGKATAASVLSRALNPEKKATKDAANQAIKKSLQANPTPIRKDRNKYITPELMEYIRDKLQETNKRTGKKWIYEYIDKTFKLAMANPESKSGLLFTNMIFNKEDMIGHLDAMLDADKTKDIKFKLYLIRQTLYDKQQEVFDNDIDSKFIIINSRRSGKTELMGRLLVKGLLQPDAHCVYINRTSSAAIRQIRNPLQKALDTISLKVVKGSVDAQEIHFDNGAQLLVLGNNNSADVDRLRGERISMFIGDEICHMRNVRQLIREVISPAMKDYGHDAKMYLVGTPPRIPHTYVEELWNNAAKRGWKTYHWTLFENPFIKDKENIIEEVCMEQGCDPDSAFIQREYRGLMGIYDHDALLIKKYSYTPVQQIGNIADYGYVLVDWGFEDMPAVVTAICKNKRMYIIDCWSGNHHGVTEISNEIKRQYDNLKDNYTITHNIQVICDNNNKEAVWDLYQVYKIPNVFTAYKSNKDLALDQLNDFFCSNKITLAENLKGSPLEQDLQNTVWKRDEETDAIMHEIDDDTWHPNALMAVLYGSRSYAYEVLNYVDYNKAAKNIIEDVKNGR